MGSTKFGEPARQQGVRTPHQTQQRRKLSREEKDWLTRNVNSNIYFKSAVPLQVGCLTSPTFSEPTL